MKYFTTMGYVYKISDRNWRRLAVAKTNSWDVEAEQFGAVCLGNIAGADVTDWTDKDWSLEVGKLNKQENER